MDRRTQEPVRPAHARGAPAGRQVCAPAAAVASSWVDQGGSPEWFALCSDVHPTSCARSLNAGGPTELLAVLIDHGAHVHGFTSVWYSDARRAAMAAVVASAPPYRS